ncbi:MAG: hypothetical protein E6J88_15445 [Deltaproteobacteria bacterium]|nr:MAG: hypothetical protein E6J88_15445 [Deltaproteobacteria bacterium]
MKRIAVLLLVGCAHSRGESRRIEITEPTVITAGPPEQLQLGEMDDATLFDVGTRAFQAGDFAKAAACFDRIAQPQPAAIWNAALSYERRGKLDEALARYSKYIQLKNEPDAQFHAALVEYKLGRLAAAAQRLHELSARPGLPTLQKASAMVQEAVCRIESGARAEGEILLRAAIEMYEKDNEEPIDPALPAQAEFWLGEAFRGSFRAETLDPAGMDEKALGDALERKAQFLLSAQGHYLRCIRRGDGEWATAAGFRIGEMYEDLYEQLVNAPLPRGLDEQQSVLYRQQLRDKVKNLVGKAIRVYEQTLSTAQRVGAQNPYVKKTEDALERLRKLLL